jgi:uncharacterized protein YdeI (YjbR/CyaY-like superfamily)
MKMSDGSECIAEPAKPDCVQGMNEMNPKVDFYFNKAKKWQQELEKLRTIILDCELTEELKWGVPCYTLGRANILLMHAFKEYCAILFHKGVLLKDTEGILIQQTANSQTARQIRFTSVEQITEMEASVKAYIHEAIEKCTQQILDGRGLKDE